MTEPANDKHAPQMARFLARDELHARQNQPRAELVVTMPEGKPPVLRIYDVIDDWGGYWGISATEVATALDVLADVTEVHVHVNSPGGQATEGIAIANLLRQHPAHVVAVVDGLAASAASLILTGANEVVVAPSSQIMIHEASGGAWGDAAYLHKTGDILDHLSDRYAEAYAAKAGGTAEEWRALMVEETWYSPAEAVAAGLADRLLEQDATTDPAAAVARYDLRRFAHAGRAHAPAPKTPVAAATGPAAPGGTTSEEVSMSETLINGLRERLGFAEDADETIMLAALDEALTEKAEPKPENIPDGHVVVPEARLRDLEAGVAASAEVAKKMHAQEREAFLDTVRAKFAPANRAAWAAEYDRDPANTKAHFEKAPDIIALAPIGHDNNPELSALDADYVALFGAETKVS